MIKIKKLFSIGEVARIKGITIKALRYYHKMNILIPKYIDDTTGYRYYSIDQFIYIDIIKSCRALGTSIIELQEIFKDCDTDKLIKFLQFKKYEAQENIKKMNDVIKDIDTLKMSAEHSKNILSNDKIEIKFFEKRYVITAPCKEFGSLKELLYYSDLEKIIKEKNIETTMERGIISNYNLEGYIEPIYVFNGVKGDIDIESKQYIKILPKGKYLTLAYRKENEEESIRKIIEYAKENNLKIENFIEVELFNDIFNTESYSCQIQVFLENN